MKPIVASILFLFCTLNEHATAQVRILFDATKAEMAGNADWVIDADLHNLKVNPDEYVSASGTKSNPQQIPTPAQSGITSSTAEGYWTGALSSWAVDCVKKGYTVESLPYNGQITYGNTGNAQDLSNYKVYIVDEPNIQFTAAEKTAIIKFVQNGGGLFMISDHIGSDRNFDGWDSPQIWDDLISNNSVQAYPFGIYFDTVDISGASTNISAVANDSIIHGPMGNVSKVYWSDGTTMTISPAQNATAKAVIFKNATTPGNTDAMFAYAHYGSGKVAAIGDSSPTDDGSGNPDCTLYDGYLGDASGNHRTLLMNATIWLATKDTVILPNAVETIQQHMPDVTVFPNPSNGNVNITTHGSLANVVITIFDVTGKELMQKSIDKLAEGGQLTFNLPKGFYVYKINSGQGRCSGKITVY